MIIGLGTDIIEIERFAYWHNYSRKQLQKIFSLEEINYCLEYTEKSAERFAVRWAAKEAFFKAAAGLLGSSSPSLHLLCKAVALSHTPHGAPLLTIKWDIFNIPLLTTPHVYISCTHNKTSAVVVVILEA